MTRESSPEIAEKADRRCLDITSSISTHLGCGKSVATLEPYLISVPDLEEPINTLSKQPSGFWILHHRYQHDGCDKNRCCDIVAGDYFFSEPDPEGHVYV